MAPEAAIPGEMNFTRLRYFVATAEEENVVRAARRLHVAQPALSRQLRALEREVGTPLLERHARGVRLLPAGVAYLEYARKLLTDAAAAAEAARSAADRSAAARLRIAPPDWPHRAAWVAGAVSRLGESHPEIEVDFQAIPWIMHAGALRDGVVDLGFGIAMDPREYGDDIVAERICDEPASSAVLPLNHPLAQRSSITLADLRDLPTITPPRELAPILYEQMGATVRRGGYEPRVVQGSPNFSATAQLVVAGAGWIITVHSVAEYPPPGMAVIPISDASVMLGFFVLQRAGDENAASAAFQDCLREHIAHAS